MSTKFIYIKSTMASKKIKELKNISLKGNYLLFSVAFFLSIVYFSDFNSFYYFKMFITVSILLLIATIMYFILHMKNRRSTIFDEEKDNKLKVAVTALFNNKSEELLKKSDQELDNNLKTQQKENIQHLNENSKNISRLENTDIELKNSITNGLNNILKIQQENQKVVGESLNKLTKNLDTNQNQNLIKFNETNNKIDSNRTDIQNLKDAHKTVSENIAQFDSMKNKIYSNKTDIQNLKDAHKTVSENIAQFDSMKNKIDSNISDIQNLKEANNITNDVNLSSLSKYNDRLINVENNMKTNNEKIIEQQNTLSSLEQKNISVEGKNIILATEQAEFKKNIDTIKNQQNNLFSQYNTLSDKITNLSQNNANSNEPMVYNSADAIAYSGTKYSTNSNNINTDDRFLKTKVSDMIRSLQAKAQVVYSNNYGDVKNNISNLTVLPIFSNNEIVEKIKKLDATFFKTCELSFRMPFYKTVMQNNLSLYNNLNGYISDLESEDESYQQNSNDTKRKELKIHEYYLGNKWTTRIIDSYTNKNNIKNIDIFLKWTKEHYIEDFLNIFTSSYYYYDLFHKESDYHIPGHRKEIATFTQINPKDQEILYNYIVKNSTEDSFNPYSHQSIKDFKALLVNVENALNNLYDPTTNLLKNDLETPLAELKKFYEETTNYARALSILAKQIQSNVKIGNLICDEIEKIMDKVNTEYANYAKQLKLEGQSDDFVAEVKDKMLALSLVNKYYNTVLAFLRLDNNNRTSITFESDDYPTLKGEFTNPTNDESRTKRLVHEHVSIEMYSQNLIEGLEYIKEIIDAINLLRLKNQN